MQGEVMAVGTTVGGPHTPGRQLPAWYYKLLALLVGSWVQHSYPTVVPPYSRPPGPPPHAYRRPPVMILPPIHQWARCLAAWLELEYSGWSLEAGSSAGVGVGSWESGWSLDSESGVGLESGLGVWSLARVWTRSLEPGWSLDSESGAGLESGLGVWSLDSESGLGV
jgi:hypothetical protein